MSSGIQSIKGMKKELHPLADILQFGNKIEDNKGGFICCLIRYSIRGLDQTKHALH